MVDDGGHATRDSDTARHDDVLTDSVADWLMRQALEETSVDGLYGGCCDRLYGAGIPLLRAHIAYHILHPLYQGAGHTWERGQALVSEHFEHRRDGPMERWRQSPLFHMLERHIPYLRRRLVGEEATLDFPLLKDLRDSGATDYFAFIVEFAAGSHDGIIGSWATDRPSGFSGRDIQALTRIQQRLAVACKMRIRTEIAQNVVTTYLGPSAGLRVLDGQIKRGDGETIHAVIWYSDLRGSTAMADNLPAGDYLAVLNSYFECAAGAVLDAGGEVLDFIGDAVLAIFPIGKGSAATAGESALAAARDAMARLDAVNAVRAEGSHAPLAFGLALHVGDVMFGNIGVPERLTFSVIGPAVNEVARLEGLTKALGQTVLASAAFARHLPAGMWEALGKHELRGVDGGVEIFTLREDAAPLRRAARQASP